MSHFCRGSATCQVRLPDDVATCGRHHELPTVAAPRSIGCSFDRVELEQLREKCQRLEQLVEDLQARVAAA